MTFTASTPADSDIRISISGDSFSWSEVGNEAVLKTGETMHYGWLFRDTPQIEYERTVLHEFGHALGALHEHQSPAGEIKWKRPVVLAWCHSNKPPWSDQMCDDNIFHRYLPQEAEFTRLDDSSIMAYSFPGTWTEDGVSMPMNWHLSNDDKALMRRIYGPAKP